MYPIGHIAVAGALTWAGERLNRRAHRSDTRENLGAAASRGEGPDVGCRIDYRLVALGALLPDIIDKPIAWFLFPDTFEDNHIFAHTLLFAVSLLLSGALLARRGDYRLLSLACGSLAHLFVDPVIREPRTLFWPLFGTTFHDTTGLGLAIHLTLDAISATLLLLTFWRLHRKGTLAALFSHGHL